MEIKIIPGTRNEEKITAIKELRRKSTHDEWDDFVLSCAGDEALLDALYYSSECGEDGLQDQENYFYGLLLDDERYYFAARLGGIEL